MLLGYLTTSLHHLLKSNRKALDVLKSRFYQSFRRLFFPRFGPSPCSCFDNAGPSFAGSGAASAALSLALASDFAMSFSAALLTSERSSGFSIVSHSSVSISGLVTLSFFVLGSSLFADFSAAATKDDACVSRGNEDELGADVSSVTSVDLLSGRSSFVGGKYFL